MIPNEFNLHIADKREVYVFATLAAEWLRRREPPVLENVREVLRTCGILASRDTFDNVIKRLVGMKWLAPRPRREKQTRYVPTLRGFLGASMTIDIMGRDFLQSEELACLNKHVDISAVTRLGTLLGALLAVGTMLHLYRLPMIGLPPEIQTKLLEVMQATIEGRPIDVVPQALEVLQLAPALECNFEYYLYYFAILLTLNLEIDSACRSGAGSELEDIIRSAVKVLSRLSQYCATRKGIDGFNKVLEDVEKRLSDDKPFVQCNNTQSQGKQKLSEFLP